MFFKKKRGMFSENNDVSKICATCRFGTPLSTSSDILCEKHGLVSYNHHCKRYDYNRLMKRPNKKRSINKIEFSEKDFSID